MEYTIRKAGVSDSKELTELTFKSKSYWNYPEEYMKVWEEELTVTDDYIRNNMLYLAEKGSKICGYYSIKEVKNEYLFEQTVVRKGFWLEHLFIHPDFIRQGIGTILMQHAIDVCRTIGCRRLLIFSDPHAQGFYLKLGANFVMDCPSSIRGRTLPMLELDIT